MLKNKIESLLFSSGRKMSVDELSRLSHANPEEIQNALTELKKDYEERDSSTLLVDEGDSWKLTVHEKYLPLVQKIVTETEMSKTVTETLAVIAFKYPIKQSNLIKIRTNKAYEHLKELEEMGYITRQKHGRTNLIKLTQKFFEYFDLSEEKLKEKFQDFKSIARAVEEKEKEIEAIKQEQKTKAEEESQKDEKIKEEIDLLDQKENKVPLDKYENKKPEEEEKQIKIIEDKEKLGNLEVVDEPSEEELEKERERIQKIKDEGNEQDEDIGKEEPKEKIEEEIQQTEEAKEEKPTEEGIKVNEEMEKMIDEKVEKMLHPKKENSEDDKKEKQAEPEEEPKDLIEASMEEEEKQANKEENKQ